MAYILGNLVGDFLIAFLIVHFFSKKRYRKKYNCEMPTSTVIGQTVAIVVVILVLATIGRMS